METIIQKLDFYNSIGLDEFLVSNANRLIQSVNLSYARYMFYKERGIYIDNSNYRLLFIGQDEFFRRYKISNKELVLMYELNREGLKNVRVI